MKISYKKILNSSYMILDNPENITSSDFTVKMLVSNPIDGLLNLKLMELDGASDFLYDISSRYSFSRVFETEKVSFDILRNMLYSIKNLSDTLCEYLLDWRHLLFHPDCIYMNRDRSNFYFAYLPSRNAEPRSGMQELMGQLLSMVDYDDPMVVTLAFNLSRISQSDNFNVNDLTGAVQAAILNSGTDRVYPAEISNRSASGAKAPEATSPSKAESGFLAKTKIYFRKKDFSEILDEINTGKIIRNIKNISLPEEVLRDSVTQAPARGSIVPPAGGKNTVPPASASVQGTMDTKADSVSVQGARDTRADSADYALCISDTLSISRTELLARKLSGTGRSQGITVDIQSFPFSIGSSADNDFRINVPTVSRVHCKLYECEDFRGTYEAEDENSTNGTFINGIQLEAYTRYPLKCGDILGLGNEEFFFR